jgi:predicted nuclease with TOPRIM domain
VNAATVTAITAMVVAVLTGIVGVLRIGPDSRSDMLKDQQAELRRMMDARKAEQEWLEVRLTRCESEAEDLRHRLRITEERALLAEAELAALRRERPSPPASTTASG